MSQSDLLAALASLQEQVRVLQEKNETSSLTDRKLPLDLSRKVKAVYATLTEQFDFTEQFRAQVNAIVTDLIMTSIRDETEYDSKLIRRAVQRFFEGRKRLAVSSTIKLQMWGSRKKLRSRRERLYTLRRKHAKDAEIEVMRRVHADLMSDEESEGEELVVRSPAWREPSLTAILHGIDTRIKDERQKKGLSFYASRKRRRGEDSERARPVTLDREFLCESDEEVVVEREVLTGRNEYVCENGRQQSESEESERESENDDENENKLRCVLMDKRRRQLIKLKELRRKRLNKIR